MRLAAAWFPHLLSFSLLHQDHEHNPSRLLFLQCPEQLLSVHMLHMHELKIHGFAAISSLMRLRLMT